MTTILRRALAVLVAAGLAVSGALVAAVPAAAEEGLSAGALARYVLDTDAGLVRATTTIDLRNTSPDEESDGGVYTYYFDAYSIPVPAGAESLRAESGGDTLPVSLSETDDPSTALARITFPDLRYGQTRRIVLTFTLAGAPPRSADNTRVGPGYATFVAYGPGDEGRNTVEVLAPSEMSFTSTVDGFTPAGDGDTTTYTATENTFDGGLWAVVSLRDPEQISERVVDVEDLSLVLESFPDDDKWASFVADTVTDGLPVLEDLVGNDWPGGLQRIREDAAPSLRGYDGWFDPTGDEIVVGEQLDPDLIYHELSHAWLSGDRFDERWLYEGLAQVIAERTVDATGGTLQDHPSVSRGSSGAVALNDWDGGAGSRSTDVDSYAYPAAYQVLTDLLGDLDDEEFAAVVGAGVRGERAYDPAGTVTPSAGRTSWSDWLDLVQTRGGVQDAPEVYATWVLTDDQEEQLAPRARARTAYDALDAADGDWLPPEGLRDAMTSWDFDRARAVRRAVADLGPDAVAVQEAAAAAGLDVPAPVRTSYERASLEDQYAALATSLPAAVGAITAVGAAQEVSAADRDPFSALGSSVLGVDDLTARALVALDGGETDPARALAQDATSRERWALPLGIGLPLLALLVLAGLVLMGVVAVRRARRPARHTPAWSAPPESRGATDAPGPLAADDTRFGASTGPGSG